VVRVVLVGVVALVAALLMVGLARGAALPWQAGCTLTDPTGAVLAQGPPDQMSALVSDALADAGDTAVSAALGAGPALACRIAPVRAGDEPKVLPLGLTPRAQALRDEVRATFGDVPDGGFGPQDPLPGRRAGGEHSLGRAVDFFFRPYDDPGQVESGWQLANWAVANAERLGIRTVIYSDRIWTAWRSAQGWRDYRFSGRDPDNPVNRHLDHVHIDVA
jgi:hypothetical protein